MEVHSKNIDRDKMAVELYFSVLRIKTSQGFSMKEAKDLAYDAVELRYNISKKRLQNIISDNHDVMRCNMGLFVRENVDLIETLEEVNSDLMVLIDKNNELLKVLKEVCNV